VNILCISYDKQCEILNRNKKKQEEILDKVMWSWKSLSLLILHWQKYCFPYNSIQFNAHTIMNTTNCCILWHESLIITVIDLTLTQ
jgi:hypothetical protein